MQRSRHDKLISASDALVAHRHSSIRLRPSSPGLVHGDSEAIQAIDGEAAICVHCGELVGLDEQHVPYNGDQKLHARCYDAHFGFERQDSPQG